MSRPDHRTPDRIRHHYDTERVLADRLRAAPPEERKRLYGTVYDELFREVPDHPQHERAKQPEERARAVEAQMRYIRRYLAPSTHFLEIGAGDCALSRTVAQSAARVTAVDVSCEIVPDDLPENVVVTISDGVSVPASGVDVAFSNQLMEHLHPDDAEAQLREIYTALKPGGRYVCITPSRVFGPHDVSKLFDDVATGFHLREYSNGDLRGLMRRAGFLKIVGTIPHGTTATEYPLAPVVAGERLLERISPRARKKVPGGVQRLLSVRVVAVPDGREGLPRVVVHVDTCDLAVAQGDDVATVMLDRDAAPLPAPALGPEHQHPAVRDLDVVADLQRVVVPCPDPFGDRSPDSIGSPPHAGVRPGVRFELDIRMHESQRGGAVPGEKGVGHAPHQLQVLV